MNLAHKVNAFHRNVLTECFDGREIVYEVIEVASVARVSRLTGLCIESHCPKAKNRHIGSGFAREFQMQAADLMLS
jgi:hypothetical protein